MSETGEDRSRSEAPTDHRVLIHFWGTRGSIPSPGPGTARYGGNTTCLEVCVGSRRLVFDAGSGIRPLGIDLARRGEPFDGPLFLTHFHWDHIQGFPFFLPLYQTGQELHLIAPRQGGSDARSIFAGLMDSVYFPVPLRAVAARLVFDHFDRGSWEDHGIAVRGLRVRHPSYVVGYRIEAAGRAVCFIPDNEVEGEGYPLGGDWRGALIDFIRGADLLVHDSMYTDQEYASRNGWGHSTFRQTLRLAEEGEVGKVLFFHHDPDRSDDEMDRIIGALREEALSRGCRVEMEAAVEGSTLELEER